jgi:hypothetical protein
MAKVNPSETKLTPRAPGERNFVNIHKVKDVSAKAIDLNNGMNNAQDKVKTYNRKKDRMGRDEIESIKAYDPVADGVKENVINVMNKVMKRVNHKNNKKLKLGKGLAIKEGEENKIQVGDHVHIGLRIRGGAGFRGKVEHIDDHGMAHVKLHSELYKDHPRIVKGHISRCTKEEMEVPAGDLVEEGLKDFTDVVKELSDDTLDDYQKKATKSARKLSATGNTGKADKRLNSVNTALDKMFSKERAKKDASNNMQDTSA